MLLRLRSRHHLIRLFLIVAIISATISPACAFISGKYGDWVEICAGNQAQKIQVQDSTEIPDVAKTQCDFCFQHAHFAGVEAIVALIHAVEYVTLIGGFVDEVALVQYHALRHARAPPYLS